MSKVVPILGGNQRANQFRRNVVERDREAVLVIVRQKDPQRLALAEGLASVAAKPGRALPPEVEKWMHEELFSALEEKDALLALRAINAIKPLPLGEKSAPLRRIALDSKIREPNRIAALRALAPNATETEQTLSEVLNGTGSNTLRRTAAELLGTPQAGAAARRALVQAFPSASADLALMLATSLIVALA